MTDSDNGGDHLAKPRKLTKPRLKPEQRCQMVKLVRKGMKKKLVAKLFNVSRQTVWKWCKRADHRGRESFRDLPREPKRGKITQRIEDAIVALRTAYGWGTARIQQALLRLLKFMRFPALQRTGGAPLQNRDKRGFEGIRAQRVQARAARVEVLPRGAPR